MIVFVSIVQVILFSAAERRNKNIAIIHMDIETKKNDFVIVFKLSFIIKLICVSMSEIVYLYT